MDSQLSKQEACFARVTQVSITISVSLLANEFDVRSVLHGQLSLAAVNQLCVIHDAMNGCTKSKDSLKDCFENVNIISFGPLSVHQRNAIPMAFRWWTDSGLLLNAYWFAYDTDFGSVPMIGIEKYGISFVCQSTDTSSRCPLTLCILMNSSNRFDTMGPWWFIM